MNTAHNLQNPTVLITHVGSYLGSALAESYLAQNCLVYGLGNSHLLEPLLADKNFTLLELDLAQPLPSYLPKFNLIFHLDILENLPKSFGGAYHLSPQLKNLITLAKENLSKLFVAMPISTSPDYFEYLAPDDLSRQLIKLVLIGDLYGPKMPLTKGEASIFANLIQQAKETDKIIMENEGLNLLYPTFISDAVFALNKFTIATTHNPIEYVISDEPTTALSTSYEIQAAAALTLGKEIGLYLAGPEPQTRSQPPEPFSISHLNFTPKVDLKEGLKETFKSFTHQDTKTAHPAAITHKPHIQEKIDSMSEKESLRDKAQKLTSLSIKFPKNTGQFKSKKFLLLILFVILLLAAKTALDVYSGVRTLQKAKESIYQGKLDQAKKDTKKATSSLHAASTKISIILFPLQVLNIKGAKGTTLGLNGLTDAASSLAYFLDGATQIQKRLIQIASKDSQDEKIDQEALSANLQKAYFLSSLAGQKLKFAKENAFVKSPFAKSGAEVETITKVAAASQELSGLIDNLSGTTDPKTYLLLLENNTELRPGGGFIGNYGLIEFDRGKLKNISVEDIYTIDGQLKEKIEPPPQLKDKLGIDRFYLRDSNWNGDFPLNAALARDFFKKETGRDVNGVIMLDLSFMANYLSKIDPVRLEDYNEEISDKNLFEKGEYYSEVGFFPGSTQKKDFFGALSRKLISNLTANIQNPNAQTSSWLALLESLKDGLDQKHVMASLDDPALALLFASKNWNRPIPPLSFNPQDDSTETRDFLGLVEANIGANKVNRFLDRKITYEMTIGRDADLVGTLKITYTNKSQAETWPGGKYVNYLRVGVPFGIDLIAYKNGDKTDTKDVEIINNANFSYLATLIEVPPKSTKEVSFTYRIHKSIKLEKAPAYHLYVEKQAGTENDSFRFTFNLPAYLKVKLINGDTKEAGKENISTEIDLSTDRQFKVEIENK